MTAQPLILMIGSTPLASFLAGRLAEAGHVVNVLAEAGSNDALFPRDSGGAYFEGDPVDQAALRRAGGAAADIVITATSNDDRNLVAAIACRSLFHPRRAVAVVFDPHKADSYGELGVEVICPTRMSGGAIFAALDGAEADASMAPSRAPSPRVEKV